MECQIRKGIFNMASINIYKLNEENGLDFLNDSNFKSRMEHVGKPKHLGEKEYQVELFLSRPSQSKLASWDNWVVKPFDESKKAYIQPASSAILLIRFNNINYAATFGSAFFLIDKYCNRDFGFLIGRKLSFDGIKTTTINTPGSIRNKSINSFIDTSQLIIESGESFAKIKAKLNLPTGFKLFNPIVEIGTSIKFSVNKKEVSIDRICEIINYLEEISKQPDLHLLPVFKEVKSKELCKQLDDNLIKSIKDKSSKVDIAQFDIVGASEIFIDCDYEYTLSYKGLTSEKLSTVTLDDIELFCQQNNLILEDIFFDITIIHEHENSNREVKLYNVLDYTDDNNRCLLLKGKWYQYNADYIEKLNLSIREIKTIYNPQYDFHDETYERFIRDTMRKEKLKSKKEVKQTYYRERAFNILRSTEDGFLNFDREIHNLGDHKYEKTDLYKDGTVFSVKIGQSSSELCYVVDQSIVTLNMLKAGKIDDIDINAIGLWIILKKQNKLKEIEGQPDLAELKMLALKNKIDDWKKQVRLKGLQPIIYINYA